MNTSFYQKQDDPPALAVIDLVSMGGNIMLLTRLLVPAPMRNKGVATALMKQMCAEADREYIHVYLEFLRYSGTNAERLRQLYTRFGFYSLGKDTLFWLRPPQRGAQHDGQNS
jgi:GNAT superfamily N-acetyltransferase